jgi:hypothetical protein
VEDDRYENLVTGCAIHWGVVRPPIFGPVTHVMLATGIALAHNKQLQRTVERRRGDAARAPFHYARASRWPSGACGR